MNISKQNAIQIVTEISRIISQHVNMMDENGMIIASTDPERIGTFHEAASRIIREELDILIIHGDNEYDGARKGINLPILQQGKIVGVIGVTGEYDTVSKYGQIIKQMTEILLLENYSQEQKKIDDRIRLRFLDEWVFENRISYTPEFIERGIRLGIEIILPRRVLVAAIGEISEYTDNPEGQRVIDSVNRIVREITERDKRNVFIKTASRMICLVSDCDDDAMRRFAGLIREQTQSSVVDLRTGIDRRGSYLHDAYRQAQKALQVSKHYREGICFYDDITMEIFMDEISETSRLEYLKRIFRGMDKDEMIFWTNLLQVFYDCDGSISAASRKLFIHKNTLQYRLNRLHTQTGYNPRKLSDAALYVLAIQFLSGDKRV